MRMAEKPWTLRISLPSASSINRMSVTASLDDDRVCVCMCVWKRAYIYVRKSVCVCLEGCVCDGSLCLHGHCANRMLMV